MENEVKFGLPFVAVIVAYAVGIGGYVWGIKGDLQRLEQKVDGIKKHQQRVTEETIGIMKTVERHDESLEFVWKSCCSDVVSDSVKIIGDEDGTKK